MLLNYLPGLHLAQLLTFDAKGPHCQATAHRPTPKRSR